MNDGLLPMFDVEAEAGVLSAFIMRPECRRRVFDDVPAKAIAFTPYRHLWVMLRAMYAETTGTIDPSTVNREIRRRELKIAAHEIRDVFREVTTDPTEDVGRVLDWFRRRWAVARAARLDASARDTGANMIEVFDQLGRDVNEVVRGSTIATARPGGFDRLSARVDAMIEGRIRNIEWPDAPSLSRIIRPLESGSITMIGGDPGDGKTFWLLGSIIGWVEQGTNAAICMLEKSDDWHLMRSFAIASGHPDVTKSEWAVKNPDLLRDLLAKSQPLMERIAQSIFEGHQVGSSLPDIARWIDAMADRNDIVIVDPISLADAGDKRWLADNEFIRRCIATVQRTNARIVLITHPNSRQGPAKLSDLMGGQTYQRATDSVLYITKHDPPKKFSVQRWMAGQAVPMRVTANRTITAFKARNGGPGGRKFAVEFDGTLRMVEQGIIVKEVQEADEPSEPEKSDTVKDNDELPFTL